MQKLEELLSGSDTFTQRSALYYLSRYIKQASYFHEYEKDIFVEASDSEPNDEVKDLTLRLIGVVESLAGKKAKDFSDQEFEQWMEAIAEIEDRIDEEPKEQQINKALSELSKFSTPKPK